MQPTIGKRAFVPHGLLDPKQVKEAKRRLRFSERSTDRVSHILSGGEMKDEADFDYSEFEYTVVGETVTVNEYREVTGGVSLPRAWAVEKYPNLNWRDRTRFPSIKMKTKGTITPRDVRQELFFSNLLAAADQPGPQNILANATTGCHEAGTGIRMFDGSVKPVERIRVGDYILGPDSKSRRVMRTVSGTQQMYRVTPKSGFDSFVVNEDHVLSLVRTRSFYGGKNPANRARQQAGEVINITVGDYLRTSKNFKHLHKLRQVSVDYGSSVVLIDPYVLGAWLGDGLSKTFAICGIDDEVLAYFRRYAEAKGASIRLYKEGKLLTVFTSGMFDDLSFYSLVNNKHIPSEYMVNDRCVRLQLLAGLLDTDGHLSKGCFEITQANKHLALQVQSLARSLGFRCSLNVKIVNHDPYYRMVISGDLDQIPTKIPRKQAKRRLQKKNHLVSGFTVDPLEDGDYYGFALNKDHLYLTEDYVVHHNSGKTVAGINTGWMLQTPTLIVVDQNSIAAGWLKNFRQFFGQGWTKRMVGRAQQDVCDYEGKAFVITMAQSLARRKYPREFYRNFGLVLIDEVQVFGGPHFSPILYMFPARVRLALTAENRSGAFGTLIKTHMGQTRVVSQQEVMEPKAWVLYNRLQRPFRCDNDGQLLTNLSRVTERNQRIANLVKLRGYDRGRNVLVLGDRTEQLLRLRDLCVEAGIPTDVMGIHAGTYRTDRYVVYYTLPGGNKRNRLSVEADYNAARRLISRINRGDWARIPMPAALAKRLQAGEELPFTSEREQFSPTQHDLDNIKHSCQIIFATYKIFSKGIDVPRLDMGVEALPSGNVKQPLGRVLRIMEGKPIPEWYSIHDVVEMDEDDKFKTGAGLAAVLNSFFEGKTKSRIAAMRRAKAKIKVQRDGQ